MNVMYHLLNVLITLNIVLSIAFSWSHDSVKTETESNKTKSLLPSYQIQCFKTGDLEKNVTEYVYIYVYIYI